MFLYLPPALPISFLMVPLLSFVELMTLQVTSCWLEFEVFNAYMETG